MKKKPMKAGDFLDKYNQLDVQKVMDIEGHGKAQAVIKYFGHWNEELKETE